MKEFIAAIRVFVVLTTLTGIVYPLVVTGIGQVAFRDQANGSLILQDGKLVGSKLIGQNFDDPKYFWPRPSATSPMAYNAASSSGSNQGPTNPALKDALTGRIKALRDADPGNTEPVPTELVTASGSGLDPHISIAAAQFQAGRVAKARGLDKAKVDELIQKATSERNLGVLGEPVVNVLTLNLSLDHPQS